MINIYVLKNKENKFVLYYFLWWKLKVATYVSPWKIQKWWNLSTKVRNVKIRYNKNELTHFSWAEASINEKNWKKVWAIMPWAIIIPNATWEFLHSSLWSWYKKDFLWVNWKLASHWCIRMPPFYNTALLKYLKNLSSNLTILDNK